MEKREKELTINQLKKEVEKLDEIIKILLTRYKLSEKEEKEFIDKIEQQYKLIKEKEKYFEEEPEFDISKILFIVILGAGLYYLVKKGKIKEGG